MKARDAQNEKQQQTNNAQIESLEIRKKGMALLFLLLDDSMSTKVLVQYLCLYSMTSPFFRYNVFCPLLCVVELEGRVADLEGEVDKLTKEKSTAATVLEANEVLRDKIKVF